MIGIGFLCHAENDNVNEMARQMAAGFLANDIDYRLIDTREPAAGAQLLDLLKQAGDACFLSCFNNVGLPTDRNSPIFEALNKANIPVLSWYLDHPIINAPEYNIPVRNHLIAQTSPKHLSFLEKFPIHGDKKLALLTHAANVSRPFEWDGDRTLPCLFVGTIGSHPDEQRNNWTAEHGTIVAENLNRMVEVYLGGCEGGLEDFILHGLDEDEKARLDWPILRSYAIVLDRFLRDRLKLLLAQLCLDAGGLVAGPGFDELVTGGRPDQLPGAIPADKVPTLIRKTRMMMSPQPEYYQSHERTFIAAANSAVPVTGEQEFPGGWLEDAVVQVDYRNMQDNSERLRTALEDPAGLEEKARTAHAAVTDRHQYANRAAEILRLILAASG